MPQKKGDIQLQRALLRALTAICYAHWEGHVKFCAIKYMQFISYKKMKYSELSGQFIVNYFIPKFSALYKSRASVAASCELVEELVNMSERSFTKINFDLIDTKSNLSSDVISDICIVCGLDPKLFDSEKSFIDIALLKRRNSIAHGEDVSVSIHDVDDIVDRTIGIMRAFGDAVENHVVLDGYRS